MMGIRVLGQDVPASAVVHRDRLGTEPSFPVVTENGIHSSTILPVYTGHRCYSGQFGGRVGL